MEQFLPQLVQLVAVIAGTLLTALIAEAIKFAKKKQVEIIQKIGIGRHEHIETMAKSTYFAMEQSMKNASSEDKRKQFDIFMYANISDLTPEELDHAREAVIGEIKASFPQCIPIPPTEQGD